MKSIFDLENRLDISKEYEKIIYEIYENQNAALYEEDMYHQKQYGSLIEAIDAVIFLKWKHRDTFMDVEEYLEHLGVDYETTLLRANLYVEKDTFLYLLEFLANMAMLMENEKTIELSKRTIAILENIPKILEKMNYKLEELEDKVIIVKRNSDVDSILDKVPENISMLLLEYNDFRICNDLKAKAKILKAIDLYLDNDHKKLKKQIKGFDSVLVDSFETVLNNMGINHQNNSDIYESMSNKEKNEWYDKCFLLMIHGIRTIKINDIKKERESLVQNVKV